MKGYRTVVELQWATPCVAPGWIGKPRLRGKPARGLKYERDFARAFPAATRGQWFSYLDSNGPGTCQVDFLLSRPAGVVVFELKLSWRREAVGQLQNLYLPVVRKALGKEAVGVVVTRSLRGLDGERLVASNLPDALAIAMKGAVPVLHWLGDAATLQRGMM